MIWSKGDWANETDIENWSYVERCSSNVLVAIWKRFCTSTWPWPLWLPSIHVCVCCCSCWNNVWSYWSCTIQNKYRALVVFICGRFFFPSRSFFETKAIFLPHPLMKQKRIVRLINGKPGENHHKTVERHTQIWHTHLYKECPVELAHKRHRHHFLPKQASPSKQIRLIMVCGLTFM